jgi:hypothetical protein
MKTALLIILSLTTTVCGQSTVTIEHLKFDSPEALREYIISPLPENPGFERIKAQDMKATALLEYAKYNLAEAREIALSEMSKNEPVIDARGLLFLEENELPQLTERFRQNMQAATYHWHLDCVERYGTADLLPDVLQLYDAHKGRWACEIAQHCLGFVVKHKRSLGLALIEEAVNLRAHTGCYKSIMLDVLAKYPGGDVLTLALRYIEDGDEEVSANAAALIFRLDNGKEKLKEVINADEYVFPEKTRKYINNLLKPPSN